MEELNIWKTIGERSEDDRDGVSEEWIIRNKTIEAHIFQMK